MTRIKPVNHLLLFIILLVAKSFFFSVNSFAYATAINQNDTTAKRLIVKYYPNGKIKEKGYQGQYANGNISTGTFVGTWKTYDQNGRLIKTVYYHNDIPAKAFIEKKEYYPGGAVKSIEKFNNYELYESNIDSIGTWKYYNSEGKLIKTIEHDKSKKVTPD